MTTLADVYSRATATFPKAPAIAVMAGAQTQDDGTVLEWWSVAVYSTPIGKDSVIAARGEGDTPEEALKEAVRKYETATACSHSWAASYDLDDNVDGFDCMKCGEHKAHEVKQQELKEGE